MASSKILVPLNLSSTKTILFLCCQVLHVKQIHQHCQFWELVWFPFPTTCWRKCMRGFSGSGFEVFVHINDSHQSGMILLQLKKRCVASSSLFLQNGQVGSCISTFLLRKLLLVGNLSLISLHAKNVTLLGTLTFHSSINAPSWLSLIWSDRSSLYLFLAVYNPEPSSFQIHLSSRSEWMLVPSRSSRNLTAKSNSVSKKLASPFEIPFPPYVWRSAHTLDNLILLLQDWEKSRVFQLKWYSILLPSILPEFDFYSAPHFPLYAIS